MFTDSAQELKKVRTLTICGLMAALAFILGSFSIRLGEYIKIGFSGLPNEVVDFMFGPAVGSVFAATMDVLKLIVKPDGAWIPGLTLNAFLAGMIYGVFLYKKPISLWRIAAAKFIVSLVINVGLATYWLAQVYGEGYLANLPARITKNVIMWPINTVILYLVLKVLEGAGAFKMMGIFIPRKKKTEAKVN